MRPVFTAAYSGPHFVNKASEQQKEAAEQSQAFTNELRNQFNTEFANSQAIQGALNAQLNSILNQGLAGHGYLNGEEAALRADSAERSAQQNVQAQQALGQQLAARSEGGALTSGALAQNVERNATQAAAENANAQRQITLNNAALARQNVAMGASGLGSLAGMEASQADALAGSAVNSGASSYQQVAQAFQPSNFWGSLASGLAGGVINTFAPGVGTMLSNGLQNAFSQSAKPYSFVNGPSDPLGLNAPSPVDMSALGYNINDFPLAYGNGSS